MKKFVSKSTRQLYIYENSIDVTTSEDGSLVLSHINVPNGLSHPSDLVPIEFSDDVLPKLDRYEIVEDSGSFKLIKKPFEAIKDILHAQESAEIEKVYNGNLENGIVFNGNQFPATESAILSLYYNYSMEKDMKGSSVMVNTIDGSIISLKLVEALALLKELRKFKKSEDLVKINAMQVLKSRTEY